MTDYSPKEIVIDDVRFQLVKVDGNTTTKQKRIGIAVSTRNREAIILKTLEKHKEFLPDNAYFVIVDDGSTTKINYPEWVNQVIRHETSLGIVEVKNSSLCALLDAGCEELFLWDDDAYPIAKGWEVPYIDSPEPHLCYQFADTKPKATLFDVKVVYQDKQHIAYTGQRGVMLYYHKSAIDKVGGFDRIYERGMYEHGDLAMRIFHAGFTTHCFADVIGSEKLIHSMDEWGEISRSVPVSERKVQVEKNVKVFNLRRDTRYTGYAEFRPEKTLVITALLTVCADPQRNGQRLSPAPSLVEKWKKSIKGADKVLISDSLGSVEGLEVYKVDPISDISPYFLRWIHIYRFLRENPQYTKVWCTDGTDVEMLREPWAEMEEGKIYVGSEHSTYENEWFKKTNFFHNILDFLKRNEKKQVLNAGLLGGSREDVLLFVHDLIQQYHLIKSHEFWSKGGLKPTETDMGLFGVTCEKFKDKLIFGPKVNTVFKSEGVGKEYAFWKHK